MLLYRRGSKFPDNLCPRPGLDLDGLSTFDSLERAVDPGEKAQVIDTDKLKTLLAVPAEPPLGHVCLTPADTQALTEWAATRGTGTVHSLTLEVLAAIVDTVRRSL
jgi:hypothetical protein